MVVYQSFDAVFYIYKIKTLRVERAAADGNNVAEATHRRRRIPRSRILDYVKKKFN